MKQTHRRPGMGDGARNSTALGNSLCAPPTTKDQPSVPARSQATDPAVLADLSNKINVCLSKADGYRVTAAQHLAEAKKACQSAGITFKDWCHREIKLSYDEARKLAKAGESTDTAKAIADMRKSNAIRNKSHRVKTVSRDTAAASRKLPPEEKALEAIDQLRPESRRNLIRSLAVELLPEAKRDTASAANDVVALVRKIVVNSVRGLSTNQADNLLKRLRGLIDEILVEHGKPQGSLQIDEPINSKAISEDLEIPAFLDRRRGM